MGLNDRQLEAVCHKEGPLIVFAGAGSGKTRVIVSRIIFLIKNYKVNPWNILAVTFTNKAAGEMKFRISEQLSTDVSKAIFISTFHSLCLKILRQEAEYIGLKKQFSIVDESEKLRVLNTVLKEFSIDKPSAKFWAEQISKLKNKMISPESLLEKHPMNPFFRKMIAIFNRYEELKLNYQSLDFDDLIIKTVELLNENPIICEKYQKKFKYILVDEYQDTNPAQYKLLSILAEKYRNIMVVGDDDQSIYRWRGADISKILNFQKDFPGAKKIILDQNYRSTKLILEAAKSLIEKNQFRENKQLWTQNEDGEKLIFKIALSEKNEAEMVAQEIKSLRKKGIQYSEIAIFFRTNAQSRLLEEELFKMKIPFKIVGNTSFFNRKEVKNLVAYLNVVLNPLDSISCKRIINFPKRGIGKSTIKKLEDIAKNEKISLLDTIEYIKKEKLLNQNKVKKLMEFKQLIDFFVKRSKELPLGEFISEMLVLSGIKEYYQKLNTNESKESLEILNEFEKAAEDFAMLAEGDLRSFSDHLSLFNDNVNDNMTAYDEKSKLNSVSLMTLHNAKGLEFPIVLIVGMEEGLCPYYRDSEISKDELEEERRLIYVGMTRAQKKLIFFAAQQRHSFNTINKNRVSRFIKEIPGQYFEEKESKKPTSNYQYNNYLGFNKINKNEKKSFHVGERVRHHSWGNGTVLSLSGHGKNGKIRISFDQFGIKKLKLNMTNLEKI